MERPGEQAQRGRTGQESLHKQDGQQKRALPEVASLGLPEEESRVASRSNAKERGRNEQPEQGISEAGDSCQKPCCFEQAEDGEYKAAPDEPGSGISLRHEK